MAERDSGPRAEIEAYLDAIDDAIAPARAHSDEALAFALRAKLGTTLRSLLERGACTRQDVEVFLEELRREVDSP
jgi:hypothetical protein